jgi:4'-phosphopantetheinyl transferase EntD
MEDLPQIDSQRVFLPLDIPVRSYLRDHHVEGRAVFPAVEALRLMGETVRHLHPDAKISSTTGVAFDKFLYLPADEKKIRALVEIECPPSRDVTARLLTKTTSKKTSITRTREHAAARYPQGQISPPLWPLDLNSAIEGVCFEISPETIYRELVPFGPAYHNIKAPLIISPYGALARIGAPAEQGAAEASQILGSPFHLDAAFHAACVWGQRFMGVVTFPVGFENRTVFKATRPGDVYLARILPVHQEAAQQRVDIWIHDTDGSPCEFIGGVDMRDVTGGRAKPPPWLMVNMKPEPLPHIKSSCRAFSVVELKALMPFAEKTLAPREKKRYDKMGEKRRLSYLAARLACKRVSRKLSGKDTLTPATDITTVDTDDTHPSCPPTDGSAALPCSVSHDDRFAIAVAAERPVGIDVEKASARLLKSQTLYMADGEPALLQSSGLGEIQTAVRIWSAKEAAAKALDISLAESWRCVRLLEIGRHESRARIDSKHSLVVYHDEVERHVFSLACLS